MTFRPICYLPSLSDARVAFEVAIGGKIDWGDDAKWMFYRLEGARRVYLGPRLPALPAGCHYQWQHKMHKKHLLIYMLPPLPPLLLKIEIIKNKDDITFYKKRWQWWQPRQLEDLAFIWGERTMPLPSVSKHQASQCTARAKSTKYRCLNPAAYGCRTCHLHGTRKPNSIKRGKDHPNYRHGTETLERKRQRSIKFAKLREIEDDLIQRGFIKCKRTVGRKPSGRWAGRHCSINQQT